MNTLRPEDNVLEALTKSMPKPSLPKSDRTMTIVPKLDAGWDKIKVNVKRNFVEKPTEQWNKHDLRYYVNHEYFEKVGEPWDESKDRAKIPALMGIFQELEVKLEKRLQQQCTIPTIKSYIDFFYDRYLTEIMKRWRVSYKTFTFDCYIDGYVEYVKQQHELGQVAIQSVSSSEVSLDSMSKANKIGKAYFIAEYGVALTYQYLIGPRSQTEEMAKNFVIDALKRSKVSGEIDVVISSTKKYTYPDWFNLQVIDEILASIGSEALNLKPEPTEQFNFLRSNK